MKLIDVADEIYRELGEPDDISLPTIAFWLRSNVGSFSDLINRDTMVDGDDFSPSIGNSEKDILKTMYMVSYYNRQVNKNLGAAAYSSFIEIKEGDRTVKRTNKNEIAKNWSFMAKDARDTLHWKVMAYKQRQNHAEVISLINPINSEDLLGTIGGIPLNSWNLSRKE